MRILIVAATDLEIAPLMALCSDQSAGRGRITRCTYAGHDLDVLTTGVGMVATAAWCSRALAEGTYDLGLNLGLCGSFDRAIAAPAAVHVVADRLSEMGAEDGEAFLTVQDLKLLGVDEWPFTAGRLVNAAPPDNPILRRLPAVEGITVNTVHGRQSSIAEVSGRFAPQVESMEGAAFMYCCLVHGLAFAQVRAVSNIVERRDRPAWNIAGAIRGLTGTAQEILDHV